MEGGEEKVGRKREGEGGGEMGEGKEGTTGNKTGGEGEARNIR